MNWSRWPNFTEAEMRCKCGCGRADMDPGFMDRLQEMRAAATFPFVITSGFRCPDYNDRISSTGRTGPHTTGQAADIGVLGHRAHTVAGLAHKYGMTGIGQNQKGPHSKRFIHIDSLADGFPRPWVWTY